MPSFIVGKVYHRQSEIHGIYKGQGGGGISTPKALNAIFAFSSKKGEQYGYRDGFNQDGIYEYCGEGQSGDMSLDSTGNKAILNNLSNDKTIHVFEEVYSAHVRYLGAADCIGYHNELRPDLNGNTRKAFIFHLVMRSEDTSNQQVDLTELLDTVDQNNVRKAKSNINKKLKKTKSLEELRATALKVSPKTGSASSQQIATYYRSEALKTYVKARAHGNCEGCELPAPFATKKGPYLEPHHVHRLADGGPDHPKNVIALCPTCHRRAHHALDATEFNDSLIKRLKDIEK